MIRSPVVVSRVDILTKRKLFLRLFLFIMDFVAPVSIVRWYWRLFRYAWTTKLVLLHFTVEMKDLGAGFSNYSLVGAYLYLLGVWQNFCKLAWCGPPFRKRNILGSNLTFFILSKLLLDELSFFWRLTDFVFASYLASKSCLCKLKQPIRSLLIGWKKLRLVLLMT